MALAPRLCIWRGRTPAVWSVDYVLQGPWQTHCAGSWPVWFRRTSRRGSDHSQGNTSRGLAMMPPYSKERFGQPPPLASPRALIRSLVTKCRRRGRRSSFLDPFSHRRMVDVAMHANCAHGRVSGRVAAWTQDEDRWQAARKLYGLFSRVSARVWRYAALFTRSDVFGRLTESMTKDGDRPYDFARDRRGSGSGCRGRARVFAAMAADPADGLLLRRRPGPAHLPAAFFRGKALRTLSVRRPLPPGAGGWQLSDIPQVRVHAGPAALPATVSDVDGNTEGRRGTVSRSLMGPPPTVASVQPIFRS